MPNKKEWAIAFLEGALRDLKDSDLEVEVTKYSSEYLSHKLDAEGKLSRRILVEWDYPRTTS